MRKRLVVARMLLGLALVLPVLAYAHCPISKGDKVTVRAGADVQVDNELTFFKCNKKGTAMDIEYNGKGTDVKVRVRFQCPDSISFSSWYSLVDLTKVI